MRAVADDFDLGNLAVLDLQAQSTEQVTVGSGDHADLSIDERRCSEPGDVRKGGGKGDGTLRPILCAVDDTGRPWTRGAFVDVNNNIGIEDFQEAFEVARSQGREETVDDGTLLSEVSVGSGSCSLNAPTGAAGELTGGVGRASDDTCDLVE